MIGWTEQKVAELKALNAKGMSFTDIGIELGFTRGAVGGKLHRLGLTDTRPKSARRGQHPRIKTKIENSFAGRLKREAGAAAMREQFSAIEIIDLPPDQSAVAVSLFKLKPQSCRWPLGDPRDIAAMRFCGADQCEGKSYCAHHYRMAYQSKSAA